MNIILVINESPWGSTLSTTALRMARAVIRAEHKLEAVFFREDGVYNAMGDSVGESGTEGPAQSWAGLHESHGTQLLVCQSSAVRRLNGKTKGPFRAAGLVEFMDLVADCDRVMTF